MNQPPHKPILTLVPKLHNKESVFLTKGSVNKRVSRFLFSYISSQKSFSSALQCRKYLYPMTRVLRSMTTSHYGLQSVQTLITLGISHKSVHEVVHFSDQIELVLPFSMFDLVFLWFFWYVLIMVGPYRVLMASWRMKFFG